MKNKDSHLSDEDLLLHFDQGLSAQAEKVARTHLAACWKCRSRRHELEQAIYDFVREYQQEFEGRLPPASRPKALLKARLAQLAASESSPGTTHIFINRGLVFAAAILVILALGVVLLRFEVRKRESLNAHSVVVFTPDSQLTPGATVLVSRTVVCAQSDVKNKPVPVALQRKVFEEYGVPRADPRTYEVDYLITPALGGAEDIRNLWPHSYSATVWNARVKDELEDRLRVMVCNGSLDLSEAQHDIAKDWIAAYKKYFHTQAPLGNN